MILILGGTGYVAKAFQRFFESEDIPYWALSRTRLYDPDYTYRWGLYRFLENPDYRRPSLVLNCAGYVGKPTVDACEQNKSLCLEANVGLPAMLAQVFAEEGIPLAHVSSGCIYQGDNDARGWSETDAPNFSFRQNNCSFYSGCKALAEDVLSPIEGYCWRLRIPFNGNMECHRNYLHKLANYDRLVNVRNSLSHIDDFVRACWELFDGKSEYGIYNVTNPGSVTTREVADMMGLSPTWFESEAAFNAYVSTPRSSCVLNTDKLAATGVRMRSVQEALADSI